MMEFILSDKFIMPIIIIVVSYLLNRALKKLTKRMLKNKHLSDENKVKTVLNLINSIIKYIIFIVAILMILEVYDIDTKTIVASLGLMGVVIGLAVQDMLKDLISGIFIVFEDQYRVGDFITVDDFTGEVISVGMKTTKIKAYNGNVKIISNGSISSVINHSKKDNLAIVDVSVSYDDDLDKVEKILDDICANFSNNNLKGKIEILGIEQLGESGIVYRLVGKCEPMKHFEIQRKLRKVIKTEFDNNNITIPYNQVVVHSE